MTPGPEYIYKCSNCGNLISRGSIRSGNTIDAKQYSDGKMIAGMLPEFPAVTICSNCKNIFWIDKAEKIGTYEFNEPVNEEWANAEEARFLTIDEYFTAIDNESFSDKEKEIYLRIEIWRAFNDRVRNSEELFKNEKEKSRWEMNADSLLKLLNREDINERIMIAELNRNIGKFKECAIIINSLGAEFNWLKMAFINECLKKNDKVFLLELQ